MTKNSQIKKWAARRERIKALRAEGWTLARIANAYKISRNRVFQIVGKAP